MTLLGQLMPSLSRAEGEFRIYHSFTVAVLSRAKACVARPMTRRALLTFFVDVAALIRELDVKLRI